MMRHKIECLMCSALKGMLIHDKVVGRRHNDVGIRIERHYFMGEVSCAGSRIFTGWLTDDIFTAYLRYLLFERTDILFIGNEVNVFLGADVLETVIGPLDQGTACTEKVKELLGVVGAAFGPE